MTTLTLYGGVGVIGGTKALLEDGDSRLFFDFGTDYSARGRYFEEFLVPRPGQGLLDLLEMGLLPPLEGLYRSDLVPPGDLWARYRDRSGYRELPSVDAVLASHAHLDHTGYISFLPPEIPIFATAMTAFIAKAVQDSAGSDLEREVVYVSPRVASGEGTRAPEPGKDVEPSSSEEQVGENALREVRAAGAGLVIADFGPRNIERLLTFLGVCEETGRQLVVLSKDAYLLDAMRLVDPSLPDISSDTRRRIYDDPKARPAQWEQGVRDRYAERRVSPAEVGRAPGDFVLCFSFWDVKNLIDIRPSGGRYIYSASEAYSEEQNIDIDRLRNWLDRFDMTGVGLPQRELDGKPLPEEAGLHASGHASPDELLRLIREVAPQTLIPVHTENPGYFRAELAGSDIEVVEPEYGRPISLG